MQPEAALHVQLNTTAVYFSRRFGFISFWLLPNSYTHASPRNRKWQDRAAGELCSKGTFSGAIGIYNGWEQGRQIRKSLFKKKWELFCCHTLNDKSTANVKWDTLNSLKPDMFNETITLSFDLLGLILAARALAKPGPTTC